MKVTNNHTDWIRFAKAKKSYCTGMEFPTDPERLIDRVLSRSRFLLEVLYVLKLYEVVSGL